MQLACGAFSEPKEETGLPTGSVRGNLNAARTILVRDCTINFSDYEAEKDCSTLDSSEANTAECGSSRCPKGKPTSSGNSCSATKEPEGGEGDLLHLLPEREEANKAVNLSSNTPNAEAKVSSVTKTGAGGLSAYVAPNSRDGSP